jgi:hypothetical protein
MATVPTTITDLSINGDKSVLKVVWNGLNTTNNVGASIAFAEYADRSFHINGTFNNANCVIEGSNDGGGNFQTLTDPQGNPISKSSAALEQCEEAVSLTRPNLGNTAGVVTDITVSAVIRRVNTMRQ